MLKVLGLFLLLTAAGCGQAPRDEGGSDAAAERAAGPGIEPTAAPGVAFNYLYAFRLPAAKIRSVQDEHAAACEKLGLARCRITAMRYEERSDEEVEAQIAFKLDPALARAFGREGIDAVARAEGELARAEITGTDVGSELAAGGAGEAQLGDEIRRIEKQLARGDLGSAERAQLQQQAQELRNTTRASQAEQADRREQLANTPVTFDYRVGDPRSRLRAAAADAGDNFVGALTVLLIVLVTLLPWALAALLGWLGWRWLNRRFPGSRARTAGAAQPEAPAAA